jgi:hypothetical protein
MGGAVSVFGGAKAWPPAQRRGFGGNPGVLSTFNLAAGGAAMIHCGCATMQFTAAKWPKALAFLFYLLFL